MMKKLPKIRKFVDNNTEELLALEKQRRGVEKADLVFVGMSNLANYKWCGMKSVLKSRDEELQFFKAYLLNRIRYSLKLDLYPDEVPEDLEDLLKVGEKIGFGEIEFLLTQRKRASKKRKIMDTIKGKRKIPRGVKADDSENSPLPEEKTSKRNQIETHPTIRWHLGLEDDYVIVGKPDGIIGEAIKGFVYEAEIVRNRFSFYLIKPIVLFRADIYGSFFHRLKKKVQIYISEEDKTRTFKERVDEERVQDTLDCFKKVEQGELPEMSKKWKCKACKFSDRCPID